MQFPILIGLRRSYLIERVLLACTLLASVMAIAFPRSTLVQGAILLAVWGLFVFSRMHLQPPFAQIRLERDGRLQTATGMLFSSAELLSGATVHPWLTVFRLKTADGTIKTVIVAVDCLSTADFRRLRVYLRWQADFSELPDAVE